MFWIVLLVEVVGESHSVIEGIGATQVDTSQKSSERTRSPRFSELYSFISTPVGGYHV